MIENMDTAYFLIYAKSVSQVTNKKEDYISTFFRYLTSEREYGKLLKSVSQCSYKN